MVSRSCAMLVTVIALFTLTVAPLIEAAEVAVNAFEGSRLAGLEKGYVPEVQIIRQADDSGLFAAEVFSQSYLAADGTSLLNAGFQDVDIVNFGALDARFHDVPVRSAQSPNYGFSDDRFIIRIPLSNPGDKPLRLYLEVAYSMLDKIAYFERDDADGTLVNFFHTGDYFTFYERPLIYPNFIFPFELEPGANKTIYLRIATTSSSQFPLRLWSHSGFTNTSQAVAAIIGALLGMVLVLAVYNLFLFLSLKELTYFYIVTILVSYAGIVAILTGYAYFYLWPNNPAWQDVSLVVVGNLGLGGLCLFVRSFLGLKELVPKYELLVRYFSIYCGVLALISVFTPYKITILFTSANVIIVPLMTYVIGLWLSTKGHKEAHLFNIAFLLFVLSTLIFVMGKAGILPRNQVTEYAIHIGAVVSALFLSFALADRVKQERHEKETAQKHAIDSLVKYQKIYESSLEGLLRVSLEGRLIGCNPAFAKLMGCDNEAQLLTHLDHLTNYIPESPKTLRSLMSTLRDTGHLFAYEVECRRIDGSSFWGALHARYSDDGDTGRYIDASIVDITEKKRNENKLNYIANHDALTGVGNRVSFEGELAQALCASKQGDRFFALLFMDLDQFKVVNDTCGHKAGDELLKQLADLFRRHVGKDDAIARMGGDEFVILLVDCHVEHAFKVGERLRKEVSEYRFLWEEKVFSVGISVGIVAVDGNMHSATDILSLADTACYAAKESGRNRVVVHEELSGDIPARQSQMALANEAKAAIENDSLVLFKQKILALDETNVGEMYEVLVRLPSSNHHIKEYLLPGSFIPALERFDSIDHLDYWVIEKYVEWVTSHPSELARLHVANINVSGKTLNNDNFESVVSGLFEKYSVAKEKICFEITESEAIHNLPRASALLNTMVAKGYQFSLDDFGSGFSSFNCLKMLPVQALKIDGSFIRNIGSDPVDRAMVSSIVTVAHTMNVKVTAEFVESEDVLNLVKQLGIDFAQGYHIHRPEQL